MDEYIFTKEDFEALQYIKDFNEGHWKAGPSALGWNYDVKNDDPQIVRIRQSLRKIKNKLNKLAEFLQKKSEFKDTILKPQKITDGITTRYLSHLWLNCVKKIEKKAPNEPQLQLTINPENIDISLWFENALAIKKYLKDFITKCEHDIKNNEQLLIRVYEPGLDSKPLSIFKVTDWDKFIKQISDLEMNCKVGFSYLISKEDVIENKEGIIPSIEDKIKKIKIYLDYATHSMEFPPVNDQEFLNLLYNKKQVILYGPPGTGKTYSTKKYCVRLIEHD